MVYTYFFLISDAEAVPEAAKVTLSPLASVVKVIPLPATSVSVSVALSATTSDCPDTEIVLNTSPPPPGIVIVLVAPVPEAVTPAPTKFKVEPAVDNAEPSSCTVSDVPPAAAMVTESPDASVVRVIFEPATRVNVSLLESAATLDCPLTAIVPKAFPPADIELKDKLPEPSVTRA